MSVIRVVAGGPWTVYDSANESFVTLAEGMEFDSGDPITSEFAWAFESDGVRPARKRVTAVETAAADPGSKRNR